MYRVNQKEGKPMTNQNKINFIINERKLNESFCDSFVEYLKRQYALMDDIEVDIEFDFYCDN